MTNERAVKWIAKNVQPRGKPQLLASQYAMEDIVEQDVDMWMMEHPSQHLEQFVELSEELISEQRQNGVSCEKLLSASMNVTKAMLEYSKIHHKILSLEALYGDDMQSER